MFTSLLKLLSPAPLGTTYYRGQPSTFGENYSVGTEVTFCAFTSVSADRATAEGFAQGKVLFIVKQLQAESGAYLAKYSAFSNEKELLLPPVGAVSHPSISCCMST